MKKYTIYQLKAGKEEGSYCSSPLLFCSYRTMIEKHHVKPKIELYDKIYEFEGDFTLEEIFERFNLNIPSDFKGHSLSVSDVIHVDTADSKKTYFVDSFGFKEVAGFNN